MWTVKFEAGATSIQVTDVSLEAAIKGTLSKLKNAQSSLSTEKQSLQRAIEEVTKRA